MGGGWLVEAAMALLRFLRGDGGGGLPGDPGGVEGGLRTGEGEGEVEGYPGFSRHSVRRDEMGFLSFRDRDRGLAVWCVGGGRRRLGSRGRAVAADYAIGCCIFSHPCFFSLPLFGGLPSSRLRFRFFVFLSCFFLIPLLLRAWARGAGSFLALEVVKRGVDARVFVRVAFSRGWRFRAAAIGRAEGGREGGREGCVSVLGFGGEDVCAC